MNKEQISYPKKTLMLAILFTVAYIAAIDIINYEFFKKTNQILTLNQKLDALKTKIVHLDVVLTSSAQLAASSGDTKWAKRYQKHEPELDKAIKEVMELAPNTYSGENARMTDEANQKLVKMEHEAIQLVIEGKKADAQKILASEEYEKQKEIYANGMFHFSEQLSTLITQHQEGAHNQLRTIFAISATLFIALAAFWFFVFRYINLWKAQITKLNNELDQKVAERTAELNEEKQKSIYATKMAALGEMAGGVAHEINNPLATIMLRSQIMLEDANELPEIKEHLHIVIRTAERISKIIQGLRNFSRDASRDPFQKVSLEKIIEDTLSFCQARFKNKDINLIVKGIPKDLEIECRATQISQILINLLNNSCDAIEDAAIKWIEISARVENETVEVSITDSGSGIPPDIAEKIMQPFFTTKDIGKGTGLGLSVSKGIIEAHGGTLKLDPSGSNTKFLIQLPLHQQTEAA